MSIDEVIKILRWLAKVRICQVEVHDECSECEFYEICTDPDSDESIDKQIETFKSVADLLEQLKAENERLTLACDEWKVVAEASRDVIQPRLRAENEELKASQPVRCWECIYYIDWSYCGITEQSVKDDDYCSKAKGELRNE